MDPIEYYYGKADDDARRNAEKAKSLLSHVPAFASIVPYYKMEGTYSEKIEPRFDYLDIARRIENDFHHEELNIHVTVDDSVTLKWSWCPIEVRVLILTQILPLDVVSCVYEMLDMSKTKAEDILDTVEVLQEQPMRRNSIRENTIFFQSSAGNM